MKRKLQDKIKALHDSFYRAWSTMDLEITKPYDGRIAQLRKDMAAVAEDLRELEEAQKPRWRFWK
jgi:hypothetical protein